MKIAFLHMTMGITDRGSEVVIDQLATALAQHNEVLVIQSGPTQPKPYQVKRVQPMNIAPPPAPNKFFDKLLFRMHLDQESGAVAEFTRASLPEIKKFNPDIIVAVNGSLQLHILQGLALQAKVVAFGHAGIGYHDRDVLRARPDLFVALTRSAEVWANRLCHRQTRVVYIPNPIDLALYQHPVPAQLNLDKPIILTIGALSAYKNILNVVSAIRSTPSSFLLIGDGEQSSELSHAFSTLANNFLWIKHLDRAKMPAHYAIADVFCFIPDPQESFGMVYLEAMASGLPIVASDDPIRRDLIGKHGIFVDPHNISSIVEGLKLAQTTGKIDYSAQLKAYDLRLVVTQIDKEFHDLLK